MIVNEVKTKCMPFGVTDKPNLKFNNIIIECVTQYKYVGNVVSPVMSQLGDIFPQNSVHLSKQARRACFAMRSRLEHASPTPPSISLHCFQSLVKPILTHGSDIWGIYKSYRDDADVMQRKFLKQVLGVKSSTRDPIVYGELGQFPISINILCHCFLAFHRFQNMSETSLPKFVFDEMIRLDALGFHSWVTKVQNEANSLGIDFNLYKTAKPFKRHVLSLLRLAFSHKWMDDVNNHVSYPS